MTEAPPTILVVEDDRATRTFLADNLTADGYELLVADSAREAMRLLETKFPDLALVDVGLPDASGLELLRQVRSADGVVSRVDPAMPFVLITGRDGELDRVRGFDRGADDYVCKPSASLFTGADRSSAGTRRSTGNAARRSPPADSSTTTISGRGCGSS